MPRLTRVQQRALTRVAAEGFLCRQHNQDGDTWFLPGGRQVDPRTARALVDRGVLVPTNDGLLDGDTQTYTLRS